MSRIRIVLVLVLWLGLGAVLYMTQLAPGDPIRVVAEDGQEFRYALEWTKNYVVADMTQADFDEMLGDAGQEALTLITCAIGTFDEATQEYRERTVLRAVATA